MNRVATTASSDQLRDLRTMHRRARRVPAILLGIIENRAFDVTDLKAFEQIRLARSALKGRLITKTVGVTVGGWRGKGLPGSFASRGNARIATP